MIKNDNDDTGKVYLKMLVLMVSIGVVLAGIFVLGASYACSHGGGELSLDGYKCVEINIVDACEYGGVYYPVEGLNLSLNGTV